jgi:hypothetical protein
MPSSTRLTSIFSSRRVRETKVLATKSQMMPLGQDSRLSVASYDTISDEKEKQQTRPWVAVTIGNQTRRMFI